jgi:hypothetical protein
MWWLIDSRYSAKKNTCPSLYDRLNIQKEAHNQHILYLPKITPPLSMMDGIFQ